MKIRNGFVSNSSSSSFCIYGVCIKEYELRELLLQNFDPKEFKEEDWYVTDFLDELHLSYVLIPDCDAFFIGEGWLTINDDETGRQFKERVKDNVLKALKIKDASALNFDTYEESWYDG